MTASVKAAGKQHLQKGTVWIDSQSEGISWGAMHSGFKLYQIDAFNS